MRFVLLAVLAVACSKRDPEPVNDDTDVQVPISHRESCPGVTAIWSGERTGSFTHFTTMSLEVAGAAKRWSLDIPSMAFDIFSPDCRHVLLLQSREGPFHVVRVDHLGSYIAGGAPDYVLQGSHDGHWLSNTELTYAGEQFVIH